MRLGFHISIAGGFSKVVENAQKTGCETIQFFSRNPRNWKYRALNLNEAEQCKEHNQLKEELFKWGSNGKKYPPGKRPYNFHHKKKKSWRIWDIYSKV